MHPHFFPDVYRERVAQFEREAEIRRHLPKRERRSPKRFASLLPRPRRHATIAAEARPCR